jgi:general L-amino acid transport system substrate-binding protein
LDVARYFDSNRMEYSPVVFQTWDEAASAYDDNRCDVLPSDATVLYATRLGLTAPGDHIVLPERLTSEQLGPYVRADDPIWLGVVRSALNALFWAEELGVTAANVGQMRSSDDGAIRRLLGIEGELGESLGLASGWAYAAIEAVGNYGESFERNLGSNSPLKMDRGQNNLVSRGGLITAPVLR